MPRLFGACYSEPNALVKIYAKQLMPAAPLLCAVGFGRGRLVAIGAVGDKATLFPIETRRLSLCEAVPITGEHVFVAGILTQGKLPEDGRWRPIS